MERELREMAIDGEYRAMFIFGRVYLDLSDLHFAKGDEAEGYKHQALSTYWSRGIRDFSATYKADDIVAYSSYGNIREVAVASCSLTDDILRTVMSAMIKRGDEKPAEEFYEICEMLLKDNKQIQALPMLEFIAECGYMKAQQFLMQLYSDEENQSGYSVPIEYKKAYVQKKLQELLSELNNTSTSSGFHNLEARFRDFGTKYKSQDAITQADKCRKQAKEAALSEQYDNLISRKRNASTENDYKALAKEFRFMNDYANAAALACECDRLAKEAAEKEKERRYNELVQRKNNASKEDEFHVLISEFLSMGDYQDAVRLAEECKKHYYELKENREEEERGRLAEKQRKRKSGLIIAVLVVIICLLLSFLWMNRTKIFPSNASIAKQELPEDAPGVNLENDKQRENNTIIPTATPEATAIPEDADTSASLNKYQYIEAVPCQYDWVSSFSEGLAAVRIGDNVTGKYGFIDKNGKEVVGLIYDSAYNFSEGLAAVSLGGKYGFIDKAGKEVIPCQYENIVNKDAGWDQVHYVYLNQMAYDEMQAGFSGGLAGVQLNGKYGFIDTAGNEVAPFIYDYARGFSDGMAAVAIFDDVSMKWGFIDSSGNEVIPCQYDYIYETTHTNIGFREGLAVVGIGDASGAILTGAINKLGEEIVPLGNYDAISPFYDGVAITWEQENYGMLDMYGKEIISPGKYENIWRDGSEGMAAVAYTEAGTVKYGYFDIGSGKILPYHLDKYDSFDGFDGYHDGVVRVYSGSIAMSEESGASVYTGKWGVIDFDGNEILPIQYDYITVFSEGLAGIGEGTEVSSFTASITDVTGGKWGFTDNTGVVAVPFIYDGVGKVSEGMAAIQRGGKWGFLSINKTDAVPVDENINAEIVSEVGTGAEINEESETTSATISNQLSHVYKAYYDILKSAVDT